MCGSSVCSKGCCNQNHQIKHACLNFFVAIRFILFILILGAVLGLAGLYILDRDRFMKEKARKMFRNIENFTQDVQKKFQNYNQ